MFQKGFVKAEPLRSTTSKPIHAMGSPVRFKASFLSLLALALLSASFSQGQANLPKPVTTAQVVAWLAGGVSKQPGGPTRERAPVANLPTHLQLQSNTGNERVEGNNTTYCSAVQDE